MNLKKMGWSMEGGPWKGSKRWSMEGVQGVVDGLRVSVSTLPNESESTQQVIYMQLPEDIVNNKTKQSNNSRKQVV